MAIKSNKKSKVGRFGKSCSDLIPAHKSNKNFGVNVDNLLKWLNQSNKACKSAYYVLYLIKRPLLSTSPRSIKKTVFHTGTIMHHLLLSTLATIVN